MVAVTISSPSCRVYPRYDLDTSIGRDCDHGNRFYGYPCLCPSLCHTCHPLQIGYHLDGDVDLARGIETQIRRESQCGVTARGSVSPRATT